MSEKNLLLAVADSFGKISDFIQTHLSNFMVQTHDLSSLTTKRTVLSISNSQSSKSNSSTKEASTSQFKDIKEKSSGPVSKEELGRAAWTFLHTLAARYPDKPTRQQKRDVKELLAILGRMYPCKECADHFKEILRENPVQVGSHTEFSLWLCQVHNVVNRSIGKPIFPCERVEARWGKSECLLRECDVLGDKLNFSDGSH